MMKTQTQTVKAMVLKLLEDSDSVLFTPGSPASRTASASRGHSINCILLNESGDCTSLSQFDLLSWEVSTKSRLDFYDQGRT